jgi:hypothetical protein
VLLALLPAFSLITGLAWWVGSGHSPRASMHRGRSVLGLLAALFSAGVLVRMAWANEWAVAHGAAALPRPLLVLWIAGLGCLAVTLLAFAWLDLRASRLGSELARCGAMRARSSGWRCSAPPA